MEKDITQGPGLGTQTRGENPVDRNVISDNKQKTFDAIKKVWNVISSYLIVSLITAIIGIGVGVKLSQKFYSEKMDDCVLSGSFVFKGLPYNIIKK